MVRCEHMHHMVRSSAAIKRSFFIDRGGGHPECEVSEWTRKKTTLASTDPEREPAERIRSSRMASAQPAMESLRHCCSIQFCRPQCTTSSGSVEPSPSESAFPHTQPHILFVRALPATELNMILKQYTSP